jgi:hypothetical protein
MENKSAGAASAEPGRRAVRSAVRRYKRLVVGRMVGGAASALGAGIVGLLFWWLKRLD